MPVVAGRLVYYSFRLERRTKFSLLALARRTVENITNLSVAGRTIFQFKVISSKFTYAKALRNDCIIETSQQHS